MTADEFCDGHRRVATEKMKISKQAQREAKQLFRVAQVNGVLDENRVRQIVDHVLAEKPRGYAAILAHLQRLLKLDFDQRSAVVESFGPLTPEVESEVKSNLQKRYGNGLNFSFKQNPSLLGGMRIQVGSDVYDGSVKARLNSIKDNFEAA